MSEEKNNDVEFGKEPATDNKKKIALIGGAVAAAVVVIFVLLSIFGGGYKKPIKNYFNGLQKCNSKTILKAFPEFMKDDLMNSFNKHSNDIYIIHGDKDRTVLLSDVDYFCKKHIRHLAYFWNRDGEKEREIGLDYRNSLAHWEIKPDEVSIPLVAHLMWLFIDIVNTIYIKQSKDQEQTQ